VGVVFIVVVVDVVVADVVVVAVVVAAAAVVAAVVVNFLQVIKILNILTQPNLMAIPASAHCPRLELVFGQLVIWPTFFLKNYTFSQIFVTTFLYISMFFNLSFEQKSFLSTGNFCQSNLVN
jgi:hypothetical protein